MDPHAEIPRLIRLAFKHAALGDADRAIGYWRDAIRLGYEPRPRKAQSLLLILERATGGEYGDALRCDPPEYHGE